MQLKYICIYESTNISYYNFSARDPIQLLYVNKPKCIQTHHEVNRTSN